MRTIISKCGNELSLSLFLCLHTHFTVSGDLYNGSETQSFLGEPFVPLNQTRVLPRPPQPFLSPSASSLIPKDAESVRSLATGLSTVAPTRSLDPPTPQGSAPQSLRGSQSSLRSFNPDIVVGGSQRDIAVRIGSGFTNLNSLAAMPAPQQLPSATERQYSIDAHADPHGQIAITTKRGSQIQKDLSPRGAQQPAAVVVPSSSIPVQRSPLSVGGGPPVVGRSAPQWGSPPFSSVLPRTTTSPLASWSPQAPTSISPKQGGTISWGVPPATTVGETKPKQTIPPPPSSVATTQAKPPHPPPYAPLAPNGGLSLAHSSSAPSLVKPQNNKSGPFLGQEPVKNGLPQPMFGLKFGGSTNPLGELKRSEPVGDLTQIRTSTRDGASPSAASGGGSGLIGHQSSSASSPNVALTTKSDTPLLLGVKFTSSPSSDLTVPATSSTIPPTFMIGGLPGSQKPPTSAATGNTGLPPSSMSFMSGSTTSSLLTKPFITGLTSLPSASKPAPPVLSSTVAASKPVFPFGAPPGGSPQFTFSLGSTIAPSFTTGSQSQAPKSFTAPTISATTHTTSASSTTTTTTSQLSGGGSLLSSMPKFSLGSASPFQFSASTSSRASSAASSFTPIHFNTLGFGSGAGSPFSSQISPPQATSAAVTTTKPSSLTTLGGSLSSQLSTSTATTKPFSYAVPGSSSFVFGDKSGGIGLSSLLPKTADPLKLQEKGQKEEKREEDDEIASSGGSSDGSGGEDQPPPPPSSEEVKPKDTATKQTPPPVAKPHLPATTLPAVQKLPTDGVSKTISQIVKPAATPKASPSETANKDKDTPGDGAVKPKEEGVSKSKEKAEKKSSPPPPLSHGGTTETKAEVEEQAAKASKPIPESDVGVAKVDKDDKDKPETVPVSTTTAVPPVPVQPPQSTTTTAASDKDKPSLQPITTDLPKDSKEVPPPMAAPKVEDVNKTSTGAEVKEKQPLVEKPAETTTAGGLSFVGMQPQQPKMSASESQGSLLSLDDIDNEADMEGDGEMEGKVDDITIIIYTVDILVRNV